MELGRDGDAAVSLRRAAQLRPNHTEAQRHLGVACAVVEDAPCAVAALKAAGARIAAGGLYGGCEVWSALGAVYLDLDLPARARASYVRALQVPPLCVGGESPTPTAISRAGRRGERARRRGAAERSRARIAAGLRGGGVGGRRWAALRESAGQLLMYGPKKL